MRRTTILVTTLAMVLCPWAQLSRGPLRAAEGQEREQWDSLDPRGLVNLAKQLTAGKTPNEKEAGRLAAYIDETYLSDGNAVRSVKADEWASVCRFLQKILSPAERTEWARALKAAYVADASALGALSLGAQSRVKAALGHLGAETPFEVTLRWMEAAPWRDLDANGLAGLAGELADAEEAGAAHRRRLARHVEETYLADAEAVRSVTPDQWRHLTSRLQKTLSAEARERWAARLRAAYLEDGETFAGLDLAAVNSLTAALEHLGDPRCREIAPAWMAQATSWQELSPGNLVSLAGRLDWCGEAGASARRELARHVEETYLADAEATRTVNPGTWLALADRLQADLPAEARGRWVASLRSAYVEDAETLAGLDLAAVNSLTAALEHLGDPRCREIAPAWMAQATSWQELSPGNLDSLAGRLDWCGEAGASARTDLADYVTRRYLADPETVRSITPGHWRNLTSRLQKTLSAEEQTAWARALKAAYVADASALKALSLGAQSQVKDALGHVGAETPFEVTLRWMEAAPWRDLDPGDLVQLARQLIRPGTAGRAARKEVARHVVETHLSGPAAADAVGLRTWRDFARVLDVSMETRQTWAEWLEQKYSRLERLSALAPGDLAVLCQVLSAVGSAEGPYLVAHYVTKTDAWRRQEGPEDLVNLLGLMRGARGKKVSAARQVVIGYLETTYLEDVAGTRRIEPSRWESIAGLAASYLDPETRQRWAGAIRAAYAPTREATLLLEPEQVDRLVRCLAVLDEAQAGEVAVLWLTEKAPSAKEEPLALASVAMRGARIDPESVAPMIGDLEQAWLESGAEKAGELQTVRTIVETYRALDDPEKARQWVMRAYAAAVGSEENRAAVSVNHLAALAGLMRRHGLTAVGKGYPAFAAALAREGREESLKKGWFTTPYLAAPLGTVEARQILQEALLDPQGNPRQGVARVLSWAYRQQGDFEAWEDLLDQRTGQTSGDTKALWLLARAYAESTGLAEPNPLVGRKWLDQALAAARTDPVRLLALDELTRGYVKIQRHQTAIDLLESVAGQMGTEEGREHLEALQAQMETTAAEAEIRRTRDRAIREARVKAAWRAELESRLKRARARDDREAVERYGRLLERQ